MEFTRKVQVSLNTNQQDKSLYGSNDQRLSLSQLEGTNLDKSFIAKVKEQAESIACLVHNSFLVKERKFNPDFNFIGRRHGQNFPY